ncbi:hypothetical protein [Mycobacterium intracellulare]|uniref:hypothetical protein n=1 Tax=Mycobacterium intracellulare TaxID=1767 RepID=UPI000BAAEE2B|nr:hypothetical protein [Mycobacterium intracellulare]ASW84793.1 hypothetical protein CKJ61_07720 [Mycobacterium intracellulare]
MSNAVAERAAAIRHYLQDHPDRPLVRKYSFLAARYEEMKFAQRDGKTTPDEDARYREVTDMLAVFTKKLNLGDGFRGFLPRDPQRIIFDSWIDSARMWFG